jgi:hypothetical protein
MLVTGSNEFAGFVRFVPDFVSFKDEDLLSNVELYKSYRFAVKYGSIFWEFESVGSGGLRLCDIFINP